MLELISLGHGYHSCNSVGREERWGREGKGNEQTSLKVNPACGFDSVAIMRGGVKMHAHFRCYLSGDDGGLKVA